MATYSLTIRRDQVSDLVTDQTTDDTVIYTNITDTNLLDFAFGGYGDGETPLASDTVEYSFDRGVQRQSTHTMLSAQFGDGYEQRARSGINSKREEISISFNNRNSNDITILSAFLDNKTGSNFNITLNNEILTVTTEEYNISYTQDEIHSLTTRLRRVYEP